MSTREAEIAAALREQRRPGRRRNITHEYGVEHDIYDERRDPQLPANMTVTQTDVDILLFSSVMAKKCFPKCVVDIQRAELSKEQKRCVAQCADRYFEAESVVAASLQRQKTSDAEERRKKKSFA